MEDNPLWGRTISFVGRHIARVRTYQILLTQALPVLMQRLAQRLGTRSVKPDCLHLKGWVLFESSNPLQSI